MCPLFSDNIDYKMAAAARLLSTSVASSASIIPTDVKFLFKKEEEDGSCTTFKKSNQNYQNSESAPRGQKKPSATTWIRSFSAGHRRWNQQSTATCLGTNSPSQSCFKTKIGYLSDNLLLSSEIKLQNGRRLL